jgi:hypothetical protein
MFIKSWNFLRGFVYINWHICLLLFSFIVLHKVESTFSGNAGAVLYYLLPYLPTYLLICKDYKPNVNLSAAKYIYNNDSCQLVNRPGRYYSPQFLTDAVLHNKRTEQNPFGWYVLEEKSLTWANLLAFPYYPPDHRQQKSSLIYSLTYLPSRCIP